MEERISALNHLGDKSQGGFPVLCKEELLTEQMAGRWRLWS